MTSNPLPWERVAFRPGEGAAELHRVVFGRALIRPFGAPSPEGEGLLEKNARPERAPGLAPAEPVLPTLTSVRHGGETHEPLLQYWPDGQSQLVVHCGVPGKQYPMVQTSFAWHELPLVQRTRQLPSTQSLPVAHWSAVVQLPTGRGLHSPAVHISVAQQSASVLQP